MSRHWTGGGADFILVDEGTCDAAGTGAFTIVALVKPAGGTGAALSLRASGTIVRQIIWDSGVFFGAGDFSGAGTVNVGNYQYVAQTKAAGSHVYRWHFLDYGSSPASTTHVDGTGAHGDGSAIDGVQLGNGDNRGNGDIAVLAAWTRELSDADVEAVFTSHLSAWNAQAPAGLWPLSAAESGNPVVDVTGNGADEVSVTGTITSATDPASFDYALSISAVLGMVTDTSSALSLGRSKARVLGMVTDTSSALMLSRQRGLGMVTTTSTALPLTAHAGARVLRTPTVDEAMDVYTGLWKFYKISRGITLLVSGSTVTETRYPWQEDLLNYDYVYLGGHEYELTAAEVTILTNAGYGAYIL